MTWILTAGSACTLRTTESLAALAVPAGLSPQARWET